MPPDLEILPGASRPSLAPYGVVDPACFEAVNCNMQLHLEYRPLYLYAFSVLSFDMSGHKDLDLAPAWAGRLLGLIAFLMGPDK